ncbi:MAG TPA: SH3 domain-containing protein [Candidatus Limnocylindrales bacterium]|nr:SH3 domain-containing protein [Candidatus Limnocylindrales bacterium]
MKKLLVLAMGFLLITVLILLGLDFIASRKKPPLVTENKGAIQPPPEKKVIPSPVPKGKTQEPTGRSPASDQTVAPSATPTVPPPTTNLNPEISQEPSIRSAQIQLRDGTSIKGDIFLDRLKIRSPYGDLALDMRNVVTVQNNKVKMNDGNVFTGEFLTKTMKVKTRHGDLDIDLEKVAELDARPLDTSPPKTEEPNTGREKPPSGVGMKEKKPSEVPSPSEEKTTAEIEEKKPSPVTSEVSDQSKENTLPNSSEKTAPPPPRKEKKPVKGITNIKTGTLNVREGEGETFKVLTRLKKGEEVEILQSSGEWYKVKLPDGRVGYVSARYIKKVEE